MHDVIYFIIVNSSCDRHRGAVGKTAVKTRVSSNRFDKQVRDPPMTNSVTEPDVYSLMNSVGPDHYLYLPLDSYGLSDHWAGGADL